MSIMRLRIETNSEINENYVPEIRDINTGNFERI